MKNLDLITIVIICCVLIISCIALSTTNRGDFVTTDRFNNIRNTSFGSGSGIGGDSCGISSDCQSDMCKFSIHMPPYGDKICQWDTSGRTTWNALSGPDHQGDCYIGSAFDRYRGAAISGKYNCERIPGWQWSGQVSKDYQWAPGGATHECRSGTAVPICVKIS